MAQRQPYISLDSVINDYLLESEQGMNKYYKVWHLAFRGFEQLGLDFFYRVQSVKLPIKENMTVELPADYLNWTKVGILNHKGEIVPLYYNDNFTTYADLLPNRLEKTESNDLGVGDWGNGIYANYWNGTGTQTFTAYQAVNRL